MIAFGGTGFLLKAIEVSQGQRQLTFLDASLSASQAEKIGNESDEKPSKV